MSGSSRTRRAVTAAVVAAAVASIGAAAAEAKTVTVRDDIVADFSAGERVDTVVRTLAGDDGTVELARTLEDQFDGAPLSAAWASLTWPPVTTDPRVERPPTVVDGSLKVEGEQADSGVTVGPGSSLEFKATFANEDNQHIGFATDFGTKPWAIFSTGSNGTLIARVSNGTTKVDYPIPADIDLTGTPTYRIAWTATGFEFSVGGVPIPMPSQPSVSTEMRVQASDLHPNDKPILVDSMVLNTHRTLGTFTSRVLDAGDARVTGLSLTPDGSDAIEYKTRSADTAAGLDDASWELLDAGGVVASPKRYLQYQAKLMTPDPAATPQLDKVEAAFTVDDEAPKVTIQAAAVSGTSARITFGSDDPDADLECSLDGAAFAACTSPKEVSGLAFGAHKIDVRATDAVGNEGTATRTFEIAKPPADTGSTPPPTGDGGPKPPAETSADTTAPNVLVMGRSARVSKRGVAKLRVRCPRSEESCAVTVKLKLGKKRIARKALTVSSGDTRTFRLRLSKAARKALAKRSRLKVTAVVTAEDAAGNEQRTTRRVTLRA